MKITSPEMLALAMREARKKSKLTQRETADRVGMKQSTVSGFEKYPEGSKMETLFKLLSALELELHVSERGSSPRTGSGWKEEW
ncbi:transcriptional regulator [Photorhabdus luminescens]|uniref:Helix-turn-helix domain-containing protein n=1 Tax=Photorhabdus luminescens subsp. mexicana TaxID=2100167 RepID=A0A4R4JR28_PHOLU|nr:helix-turn-helix domain-containing protein [Photorhabdus luminescens]MCW7761602.1 helix-turn-helix domain-containing protein [Photorhabdus luminescens subsp. venezuelensis]OWO81187.1 transcriptional regulator [Photorhabdus luminescens]TDB55899.1 helix-turn-helix domain-containing protein [Photorhabdus luminescens subsp. mexicana]